VNDAPDPYPDQTRCFDVNAGAQGMDNASAPNQLLLPVPTDPDLPAQTLSITVASLPTSGVFVLDGQPIAAGQTLTPAQWQRLQFQPNATFTGPVQANGTIDGGALVFVVNDGNGGQVTSRLNLCIKPAAAQPPTQPPVVVPPVAPPPVVVPPAPLPPIVRLFETPPTTPPDLTGGNLFESERISGLFGDELIGPWATPKVVAETKIEVPEAPPPTVAKQTAVKKAVADCDPPVVKAKPKAVKRTVFADKVAKASTGFSEQVKDAKKRFKPPAKVVPKVVQPDC
jgi:hypothetical protein